MAKDNKRLTAAMDALLGHIDSLQGESSVIDEDLMQGEAYGEALAALEDARAAIIEGERPPAGGLPLDVIATANGGYDIEAMVRAELKTHGYIATLWHVDDVTDIRPDLTHDQAMQLLEDLDANQGIILETVKHDVISDMANTMAFDTVQTDAAAELAPAQPEMDAP
jgi:hypothetical protein